MKFSRPFYPISHLLSVGRGSIYIGKGNLPPAVLRREYEKSRPPAYSRTLYIYAFKNDGVCNPLRSAAKPVAYVYAAALWQLPHMKKNLIS